MRRNFHMHPELGFKEFRTSGIIKKELQKFGIEVESGIGGTGVVGLLKGYRNEPVVLLRFDMDALPILEENKVEYASKNKGVMHACGHDGHMAIGLSVAKLLSKYQKELPGTIKFVFQPAEEGLGGALKMIEDGVLKNPKPNYSLAMHLWNEERIGWISVTESSVMAASETFNIHITGRGGHGAAPHQTIDPIYIAAQIVNSLQSIVSRNIDPLKTGVVSVTSIHGGDTFNVIPQYVDLSGTIRTFAPETRELVLKRFKDIVSGVTKTFQGEVEYSIVDITPAVINDEIISKVIFQLARNLFPEYKVVNDAISMGSEDMAYMMKDIPGCYMFVGSSNPKMGLMAKHHHPKFDFDEQALIIGVTLMSSSAYKLLEMGDIN